MSVANLLLSLPTTKPAVEKTLSAGVDVARMHPTDLATGASGGNLAAFVLH